MNIVHIGAGTSPAEIKHIAELYDAGHCVYMPGPDTGEQLVRRIMDADEIHIWDITREFELGMVYFYSVHALHYRLSWRVRMFNGVVRDTDLSGLFLGIAERERELTDAGKIIAAWPEWKQQIEAPSCAVQGPPCHSGAGPCNDCADDEKCNERL